MARRLDAILVKLFSRGSLGPWLQWRPVAFEGSERLEGDSLGVSSEGNGSAPSDSASPISSLKLEGEAGSPLDQEVLANLQLLGGQEDPGFLNVVIDQFFQDAPRHFDAVCQAIEQNDSVALIRAAHLFKGGCGNMGAQPLAALLVLSIPKTMRSPRALPDGCLSTQRWEVILARALSPSSKDLPARLRVEAATARKREAASSKAGNAAGGSFQQPQTGFRKPLSGLPDDFFPSQYRLAQDGFSFLDLMPTIKR